MRPTTPGRINWNDPSTDHISTHHWTDLVTQHWCSICSIDCHHCLSVQCWCIARLDQHRAYSLSDLVSAYSFDCCSLVPCSDYYRTTAAIGNSKEVLRCSSGIYAIPMGHCCCTFEPSNLGSFSNYHLVVRSLSRCWPAPSSPDCSCC